MCLFPYGWYYLGVRLQIRVCLIRVISRYSNGAVQIWVGLELAEFVFGIWNINMSRHMVVWKFDSGEVLRVVGVKDFGS